jgi:hypothetical protein
LFVLNALREDDLYPGLPAAANYAIAATYVGCALGIAAYMNHEYSYCDTGSPAAQACHISNLAAPREVWETIHQSGCIGKVKMLHAAAAYRRHIVLTSSAATVPATRTRGRRRTLAPP